MVSTEKWICKRLALRILSHLGGSPLKYYVVLCWLAFLSMWMSNTATAMMMLPIVFSVSFGRNAWGKS
jgi:sodium-dependent dicarboxylate transporter 2/3/5